MLPRGLTSLLDSGKKRDCSCWACPFWILVKTKRLQLLGLPLLLLLLHAAGGAAQGGAASLQTHPSPHRNTMLLKDGTTSKNMLPRGLTPLLDSGKNKAIAAAGPAAAAPAAAAAAGAATRGGAASLQNAPFATPKHHATEGRNDLQINRKNKFPGGRNLPSEILLEPPKTCCPGACGCSSKKPTGRHLFRNTAETAKHHLISCRK